jgi:hypothetical protein
MKYQRFVSLTAGLSFVIMFISSGVLYFIPDRQVTSWTDWKFLGLDKQQWDNLHINLGILFLVMIVWHIYYNWKPITNYLKVKKRLKVFTKEFNVAMFLTLLFTVGTITMTLPFSILVNLGNGLKAINSLDDGNPPFSYAEYTSLEDFARLSHLDIEQSLQRLKERGIRVLSRQETLKKIAKVNAISPKEIYIMIKDKETKFRLPTGIPVGIAHKSLKRLSQEYVMDLASFLAHLKEYGIEATAEKAFKRVAKENHLHPAQLYNMLLASQIKN